MNKTPLISVIMPVYNKEEYIAVAIESILNQTLYNFEFIIIDDGSNDNSINIAKEFQQKDERIIIIQNKKNIGLSASLNKGIKASNANYIARQDADDISKPQRLEKQFKFMETRQNIALLGTSDDMMDINGIIFCCNRYYYSKTKKVLKNNFFFAHGSVMFRRDIVRKLGGYNKKFLYTQDLELWLRFYRNGYKIAKLEESLYTFRCLPNQYKIKSIFQGRYTNILISKEFTKKNLKDSLEDINKSLLSALNRRERYKNKFYLSDYWFYIAKQIALNNKKNRYFIKVLFNSIKHKNRLYIKYLKLARIIYLYFFF